MKEASAMIHRSSYFHESDTSDLEAKLNGGFGKDLETCSSRFVSVVGNHLVEAIYFSDTLVRRCMVI